MKRIAIPALLCVLAALRVPAAGETIRFTYDAAGRLITAHYRGATEATVHQAFDPNGNRTRRLQIGGGDTAFDSDSDGLSDLLELRYFGTLSEHGDGDPDLDTLPTSLEFGLGADPTLANTDGDGADDRAEWIADTDPADARSVFRVERLDAGPLHTLFFTSSVSRLYTLLRSDDLVHGAWTNVPGLGPRAGTGGWDSMTHTNAPAGGFYRVDVTKP